MPLRKFSQSPPAVVALLIQITSLGFLALALFTLRQTGKFQFALAEIVLLQIVLTLLMTRCFNLAWWWYVIQLLFPLATLFMLTLSLPPFIYFLFFSFFLAFYWSTFRTQVPYFPSTKKVWVTVEKLLPENRPISFVDIGSGFGGLVLYLARKRLESRFLGVEIVPLLWVLSYLRTVAQRNNAQFIYSDYEKINFSQFDVVFVYLSPAAMSRLWVKAKQEMLPGSILISLEFPIFGAEPDYALCSKTGQPALDNNETDIYLWRM